VEDLNNLENEDDYFLKKANHHYEANLLKNFFCLWTRNFLSHKSQKKEETSDDFKVGIDHFVSELKSKHEEKPVIRDLLKSKAYDDQKLKNKEELKKESPEEDNIDWGEERLNKSFSQKRTRIIKNRQRFEENNEYVENELQSDESYIDASYNEDNSFSDMEHNEIRNFLQNIVF